MSDFSFSELQLRDLSAQILEEAARQGATACETEISESVGKNVSVRLGEIETIEYNHDKGIGVTVYLGGRKGHASTSDFSAVALRDTVQAALAIARHTAEDPCAGLPEKNLLATGSERDLDLYHPCDLSVEAMIDVARECEQAGRAVDARIDNSEGASVYLGSSRFAFANSLGFVGSATQSRHSLSATLIAEDESGMQRDYWYDSARNWGDMQSAAEVGRIAGERTVRRLGARRIKTGEYPVLFEAPMAGSLIGNFISAVSGGSLYRKASFLLDSLGQPVLAPCVSIHEDPFLPRGLASSMFDAEGVTTRARSVVEAGVLQGYFLSSYSARKLGMQTTGNAGGAHNLLVPPTATFGDLLAQLGTGLLVTELLGHGVNQVTGDYSRGAAGFWVENGVIQHAVEEITIAGNLKDMFLGIVGVGDDARKSSSRRVGSILIDRMKVASA
ncbi:PmbA protein [Formivibrio citricus]|uniref:PmbA protein n=1 Tax=Formivibrio citricus TaxID=83765 RepID=A0A1I4V335_9NEIS|nr:metalloprotease PmbA [Formivibrio citricus]SFM95531.1 PmbA protein [Formivibrio citricus]